ncbi:MAG: dehydrogenase [Gemmatimonadetes bacterium]|nr:dehydrogenase [Gemmatimonadota bacterium]|tara:strand:+ start:281 stop:1315 length:1035 start_codon:yes stop_codon:yes gene_type:complete
MINAAVVGYGYSGRAFQSYLISLTEGINLYAISTRDTERQAEAKSHYPDAKIFADFDEMLGDDQVDLVVIATPHDSHADLAVRAMDAGKHVVTDKIMCMNAREARQMIAASERNEVMLSVFHNRRWDWDYLTIRKAIEDGLLGEPYLYQVAIMRYGSPGRWRGDMASSGGILYDWPAHFVDQALQLVDSSPDRVFCHLAYRDTWETDIGNYGTVTIHYANDVIYQIEIGNLAAVEKPRWYVCGDQGALIKYGLDPQEPYMREGRILEAEEDPEIRARVTTHVSGEQEERILESVRGSWTSYYANISDVLNNGAELVVTPDQMMTVMRVYDAAMESAETGEVVRL